MIAVRPCVFKRVQSSVKDRGVGDRLESLARRTKVGRPRKLSSDILLTAMVACAIENQKLSLRNIHQILTTGLPRSFQIALGIRKGKSTISYKQVEYLFNRIIAGISAENPDGDPQAALEALINDLIAIFIPRNVPLNADYSMDATNVPSWAHSRGKWIAPSGEIVDSPKEGQDVAETAKLTFVNLSADPDARHGYRTKTRQQSTEIFFGFNAFTAVAVPTVENVGKYVMPYLTHAMTFRSAEREVTAPGLALVDNIIDRYGPINEFLYDRAWSQRKSSDWMRPILARGITPVFDFREQDATPSPVAKAGSILFEGEVMCPATPVEVLKHSRPSRLKKVDANAQEIAELDGFRARIAEREAYTFRIVARDSNSIGCRFECPARAGKVRCPLVAESLALSTDTPKIVNPPAAHSAPRACTQRTHTVKPDIGDKNRQKYSFGTEEWINSYSRRSYIESEYGKVKSQKCLSITRGFTYVWGMAKTAFMVAMVIIATNLRALRKWAEETDNTYLDPLCAPDPEFHGWEELDDVPDHEQSPDASTLELDG